MKKNPKIRYVDMCIWVDTHIRDENKSDADIEKLYEYLRMIAYMLACKRRFFNKESDYDLFSHYIATELYNRMTTPRQYLSENDSDYIAPIKSCLNYMKQILYARKCDFIKNEIGNPIENNDADLLIRNYMQSEISLNSRGLLKCDIELYLNKIDTIIHNEIYNGVYSKDKVLAWKLYTSVLISFLRNITLSNDNKQKFNKYNNGGLDREELYSSCIEDETVTAPIVYDLDSSYLDYVAMILQKIKSTIITDINEFSSYYDVSDDMIGDVLSYSDGLDRKVD